MYSCRTILNLNLLSDLCVSEKCEIYSTKPSYVSTFIRVQESRALELHQSSIMYVGFSMMGACILLYSSNIHARVVCVVLTIVN